MVKNVKGGSKHKKFARKNLSNDKQHQKTRLMNPKEPCEMYANVIKLFGQGMCEVKCNDGINRLCIIRNKFRGKNRRQNQIYVDCKILVGIRDWELVKENKLPKCDLLEVYERRQFNDIKNDPKTKWENLAGASEKIGGFEDHDAQYEFGEEDDTEVIDDKELELYYNENKKMTNILDNNETDTNKDSITIDKNTNKKLTKAELKQKTKLSEGVGRKKMQSKHDWKTEFYGGDGDSDDESITLDDI